MIADLLRNLDQHSGLYFGIAYGICRNFQDAEDALQNAAVNLMTRRTPPTGVDPRQWVARVVTNACIDLLRHNSRRQHSTLNEAPCPNVIAEEAITLPISGIIHQLDSPYRTALELMDVLGLSTDETAWLLNTPEGTIKSRRKRGKDRLGELLATNNYL